MTQGARKGDDGSLSSGTLNRSSTMTWTSAACPQIDSVPARIRFIQNSTGHLEGAASGSREGVPTLPTFKRLWALYTAAFPAGWLFLFYFFLAVS